MRMTAGTGLKAGLALVFLATAIPVPAAAPEIALLARIEKGNWQLKARGSDGVRNICVRTGEELLALRHRAQSCSRYVIENAASEATVHLTCGAAGHVRTTLRYETPRLIQIDTQGLQGTSPFSDSFEARRAGQCR